MNKFYANAIKKLLITVLSLSLAIGLITVPTFADTESKAGGVNLPTDSFIEEDYDDTDFFPFYAQLSDNQKRVYKIVVENIENNNTSFSFAEAGDDDKALLDADFTEVLHAVYYEHPELFWFGSVDDSSVAYTVTTGAYYLKDKTTGEDILDKDGKKISMDISVELKFNKYADDLTATKADFNARIAEILAPTTNMSEGEKAYYIHNKVCELVAYDYQGIEDKKLDATVYGTLVNGRAVCQGYARTLQYLLEKSGIPATPIFGQGATGATVDSTEKVICTDWEAHCWVIAKIGGTYYDIDVTWDDFLDETQSDTGYSYISFDYCVIHDNYYVDKMVKDSKGESVTYQIPFGMSHVRDEEFEFLPTCETEADFESLTGVTRMDAFTNNFDMSAVNGVMTDEASYVAFDEKSVFQGSQGDVKFTLDSSDNVTSVSGTKKTAGENLVKYAAEEGWTVPWTYINSIISDGSQSFIVTGDDNYKLVLGYDRYDLNQITYRANIGNKNGLSSMRETTYYEFQNECYVFIIEPTVFIFNAQSMDKKAEVIDWAEKQPVYEVEQGGALDLSGKLFKVYYNDLTSKSVDASTLTVSGFDSSVLGYQDVTLTYTGDDGMLVNTATLRVNVTEPEPEYETGDVNGDGQLNSDDAILVLMYTQFPTTYTVNQGCDFNGDGQVNSDDAIRVLMYTQFPEETSYKLIKNNVYVNSED